MLPRIESPHANMRFAEPTPLGLLGLAIGCAALTPVALRLPLSPTALETAAMFCLLFGGGCQLVSGLLNFANKNLYGGTLLTAFAFQWFLNYWVLDSLASGFVPDHGVVLATEILSLLVFIVFTYGFGFYSTMLFVFLLDIVLLYVFKVVGGVTGLQDEVYIYIPIAICTVILGLLALWIAFAMLINPTAGRAVFPVTPPVFKATPPPSFDFATRRAIFQALYARWQDAAFAPMAFDELKRTVGADQDLLPDLCYLTEQGAVQLEMSDDGITPEAARLTALGIDTWERRALGKHASS